VKAHLATILVGVIIGSISAPLVGLSSQAFEDMYDRLYPVVEARVEVITKTETEWYILMYTSKKRDCKLLEVLAYNISPTKEVSKLVFERKDGGSVNPMPLGNFRSANYVLRPPPKDRLDISFLHECSGRTVRSPVHIPD
jgi:hypothetical protein